MTRLFVEGEPTPVCTHIFTNDTFTRLLHYKLGRLLHYKNIPNSIFPVMATIYLYDYQMEIYNTSTYYDIINLMLPS